MMKIVLSLLALICSLSFCAAQSGITVTMNDEAARGVLEAMQNPKLSREDALKIAMMPGNQGAIRKLQEFRIPAATESFASALYKTVHNEKITDRTERSYQFDMVQPKSLQLLVFLKQIGTNPQDYQQAIERRIMKFTPPGADLHLKGYILAAGDGGGYAFGGTDFYLNIGMDDEPVVAKSVTTHELYHAVQGAFASQRDAAGPANVTTPRLKACSDLKTLFANLYEEGTAEYVADPSTLSEARSAVGRRIWDDTLDGLKHVRASNSLLEMSVISISADHAPSYDDIYEVGFLGHGTLYTIAYVMATAIAEDRGPQGIADLLTQPPYMFFLRYEQLPKYGQDDHHPALGPHTVAAAKLQADGCK